MSISLLGLCSDLPVQFRRRSSLKLTRSYISIKHHFGIAQLIHITVSTKLLETLFASIPTRFPTTGFCAPYFLVSSSLVFSSSLFLFSSKLNVFSAASPTLPSLSKRHPVSIAFVSKFLWTPYSRSTVHGEHLSQTWPPKLAPRSLSHWPKESFLR